MTKFRSDLLQPFAGYLALGMYCEATRAARYEAQLQGRKKVTFDDIKSAIATSVMPSDVALQEALTSKSTKSLALTHR